MSSHTPPPNLNIPPGTVSIPVSLIDTTLWLSGTDTSYMYTPSIPTFGRVRCGCWSFLIQHPSGRNLLYDLGTRKDWQNTAPGWGLQKLVEDGVVETLEVKKNVSEILEEGGIDVRGGAIEGVIWSHWHFDHTGDVSTFPKGTKLIVGEGTKAAFLPGYPTNPDARVLESDFEGREVQEITFGDDSVRIGGFRAHDYFGDGSFYILDSPGHAIGHVNALVRTKTSPPEFVHLCGDSAHHCGEIRPSAYIPLPDSVTPSPLPHRHPTTCPGGLFSALLRNGRNDEHILELIDPLAGTYPEQKYAIVYDAEETMKSVRKVEGFDGCENVFTVLAHDWSIKGFVDEWPETLNGWREKGWKRDGHWRFLSEFF